MAHDIEHLKALGAAMDKHIQPHHIPKPGPLPAAPVWENCEAVEEPAPPEPPAYATGFAPLEASEWGNAPAPQAMPTEEAAGEVWEDPIPLPSALPPVARFDLELLPQALRGWVGDIASRMQCPPDFPAIGALVALSSLIGARAVVKPKTRDDWAVVPVLWGIVVGRPGVMKSPALSEVLKPLHRLESTERELHEVALSEWELDAKVAELASEANAKQAKSLAAKDPAKARELLRPVDTTPPPVARRYLVNDATVEKLGELLTENPWGILTYRDELHGLLTSMDRQGQEGARAFYLQAYDGNQGYTFDRIGRGVTRIERVCMAMLGGIQPGKVQSYVRDAVSGGASDDGLLQRFSLAVWPDIEADFQRVDRWPDTPAKQQAWAVFERLAKYRKLIPALALIFALVDTPDSGGIIESAELLRALAWGDYLRTHAERLYAAATVPETAAAQTLLTKLKTGKLTDRDGIRPLSFTPREVAVKHWAGLGSTDEVRKAATLLADYGWLEKKVVLSGDTMGRGRHSDRYWVHPCLLKGGKA